MHLFLPLASSVFYVVAALFLKQASDHRVGVWRTAFICNWTAALAFLCLWPLGGEVPSAGRLVEPALTGLLFVLGQVFTFLALEKGDVSVATPVLAAKVVIVAVLTVVFLGEPVGWRLWTASVLSFVGVVFLNRGSGSGPAGTAAGWTILFSLQAALAYSLFDILVMKWAPDWGVGRFPPIMMLFAGLQSLIFIPRFSAPLRRLPRAARVPLAGGAFFMALQAILLITTLARFGDATAVNVVYSSRGLWSVVAVWCVGHWFGNRERDRGGVVLRSRFIGAALLASAVVLALT